MIAFAPNSIAVIGASSAPLKVGHLIFKNLIEEGFPGEVYPVNPKGGEILGKKVFTSLAEIPGPVDMAVIVTPAPTVAAVIEECGAKKTPWVVVITAGFGETHTDEGKKMEKDVAAAAKKHGIHLIGPNCLGVLQPKRKMNASFAKELPPAGSIALISQSGAMAVALMDMAGEQRLGYSMVLSIGNKATMNECDYLELCAADEDTSVIGMYLESIEDGTRFLEVAREIGETKPIVLLKSGVSEHGRKAASSHTGALAGSDAAIQAACAQAGIHRAHTAEEFLSLLRALSTQPPLLTDRIAIVTNAGGPGILATDATEQAELQLPTLEQSTLEVLKPKLPASASTGNPIDVIGDALADRYEAALTACGDDPNIDGLCVLLTPQVMTPCADIAKAVVATAKKASLMPIVTSFMGGESVRDAVKILAKAGIPNFATPEQAVHALAALRRSPLARSRGSATPAAQKKKATAILKGKKGLIDEDAAKELLALYDLPLPQHGLATTADEAVGIAQKIHYPVIAKISSPQILHKTDIGGIRANLKSDGDVRLAFEKIMASAAAHAPEAHVNGVLIQQFLPIGSEFIIGGLRDRSFGSLVMVGLGGIYTELFRDTVFRIAPISQEDAFGMLTELKSWKLLLGLRGQKQSDIEALAATVSGISKLMTDCTQIEELDLNPVLVGPDGVVIADVKIVVAEKKV